MNNIITMEGIASKRETALAQLDFWTWFAFITYAQTRLSCPVTNQRYEWNNVQTSNCANAVWCLDTFSYLTNAQSGISSVSTKSAPNRSFFNRTMYVENRKQKLNKLVVFLKSHLFLSLWPWKLTQCCQYMLWSRFYQGTPYLKV